MLSKKNIFIIAILFLFFTFFPQFKNVSAIYVCNQSCVLNPGGCNAPLVCSAGLCRNPSCLNEISCICPTPTPTATPTPTLTPTPTPTNTPTPTATPTPASWYKLKNSSFNKKGNLINPIPPAPLTAFDVNDYDTQRTLIVNDPTSNFSGIVSGQSSSYNLGGANFSSRDWSIASYLPSSTFSILKYVGYIKSRKEYKTITNPINIVNGKINILPIGYNLNINTESLASSILATTNSIVLIVQGNVNIGNLPSNKFNPTKKSIAIISTGTITFGSAMDEINGIFIADSINFSDTLTSTPLKIQGNLISQTPVDNSPTGTGIRARTTNLNAPSIFIIFNPKMYTDLLPDLSVATYDWRQMQ